jgi:ABC-2 type transport system ATP-binding protein
VDNLRSGGTTVLLTTQYLEEADRLADRVVLIDHGRVVAEGTPAELKQGLGAAVCTIRIADPATRSRAWDLLARCGPRLEGDVIVVPEASAETVGQVADVLARAGVEPDELTLRRATLDEVFLTLTGHPARADRRPAGSMADAAGSVADAADSIGVPAAPRAGR